MAWFCSRECGRHSGDTRSPHQAWARSLRDSVHDPRWSEALTLPDRWQPPKLPVKGADVMARGIPAGPKVGEALRTLEAWWIEQDFAPDREALLARL